MFFFLNEAPSMCDPKLQLNQLVGKNNTAYRKEKKVQ